MRRRLRRGPGRRHGTAVLCDGLGHGPLAAAAAAAGWPRSLTTRPATRPRCSSGCTGGWAAPAAGRSASCGSADGVARFSGLGNVAASILAEGRRKSMISIPGIAGHQARTIRQFDYELPPGAAVILHSDGISARWEAAALPGLETRDPLLIAAVLLGEAGIHRDDAGILVLKP